MKISDALILAFTFTVCVNAHHCNEFTSNINTQQHGWFGRKRRVAKNPSKLDTIEEDLIHRHDMHSFTGAEGIDHHSSNDTGEDVALKPRAHKKMLQLSDNLLRRHDMHSYTSLEGMDHVVSSKSVDEHDKADTPAAVRNSRRRRIDRSGSPRAATKPVKQVQQKHDGNYPGESYTHTI